jgi:hypothetical protein
MYWIMVPSQECRPARGIRGTARRARRDAVRRTAAAHRDRARDPARRASTAARRGDDIAGRGIRDAGADCARGIDASPDHVGDRASACDSIILRSDRSDGAGPHRRAGGPRLASRRQRTLRAVGAAAVPVLAPPISSRASGGTYEIGYGLRSPSPVGSPS